MTESIPAKHTRNSILAWAWRLLVLGLLVGVATRGTEWNLVWDRIRELSSRTVSVSLFSTPGCTWVERYDFKSYFGESVSETSQDLSAQHTLYLRILHSEVGNCLCCSPSQRRI